MPRTARQKSPDAMYHVMCRSISEVDLFRNDQDKEVYMRKLRHYKDKFAIRIHAYCLMDNHAHIIIEANGADISKVLHGLNHRYAIYYNKKYDRHGHLFQGRFKSKIINNNGYFVRLSAYIHNNPHSMEQYEDCIEKYKYSSLGMYLGMRHDEMELIEKGYLLSMFRRKGASPVKLYMEYVKSYTDDKISADAEFKDERTDYVSERKTLFRNCTAESVAEFLKEKMRATKADLLLKGSKKTVEQRAIFALFLKCFCNYRNKDICGAIGNISQSRVSMLCDHGLDLIRSRKEYQMLMSEFTSMCMA
ncbi:MAG: transposase [Clostridiaceae bacterium]